MSSLFARIFLWFWVSLTLVTVGFVLIAAATFPEERRERWESRIVDSLTLRGQRAIAALDANPGADTQLTTNPEQPTFLVRDGKALMPKDATKPIAADQLALAEKAAQAPEGTILREDAGDFDRLALSLGKGWSIITDREQMNPFSQLLEPRSLPWRMALVILVAGLVAVGLARYLTRPLRILRTATGKVAAGDLAVRVTPELGRAGGEIAGLGRDFDQMAIRLEALLDSQRRLLGDVSHELRSPLARLNVALELARKRSGDAAKNDLDRIERESERLATLISEILTLTKLETAEAAEPETTIDLQALVTQIAADVDYEAKGSNKRVAVVEATPVLVSGRPETLRRAVENVLRNAVRFTGEGTTVELSLARLDDGGRALAQIVVKDHGPGVPESALSDIFRPFYRVGEDRDRKTGGAGVGLAIVERALKLHHGSVDATNRTGSSGLVVRMRLPVGTPTVMAEAA